MKSPMATMEEIVQGMSLKANPQAKQLLSISASTLRTIEERMCREAYEAGRNDIKGVDPKISIRKSGEYFNNKFGE